VSYERVAYTALMEEYQQLATAEMIALFPIAVKEGFTLQDCLSEVGGAHPAWKRYLEKCNKKYEEREKRREELERVLGVKIARTPWEEKWIKKGFKKS